MRTKAIALVIAALSGSVAFGQNVDRVFHFANIETPQGRQELSNLIRADTGLQKASLDNAAGVLAVSGTASRVALADWLFAELDKPARLQPPPQVSTREYRVDGSSDDIARVVYLANTPTPQARQELVNAIRSLTDIQRIVSFNPQGALAMRAASSQIAAAEWLIGLLDKPAPGRNPDSGPHEYRMTGTPANVMRVFYPKNATTPQALVDSVNLVRSTTHVQRAVGLYGPRAVSMRGTSDQAALAEQLIKQMDKP